MNRDEKDKEPLYPRIIMLMREKERNFFKIQPCDPPKGRIQGVKKKNNKKMQKLRSSENRSSRKLQFSGCFFFFLFEDFWDIFFPRLKVAW